MFLGIITLFTALAISGVAAYYSIVGLTAIFAAAVTPIVIMGVVLEVGKVVTTLWLHYNWERSDWKIKGYLVTAVGVLMFITSMGIFGFLSKAHLEQAVPSGDVQAQVQLFDEKIKTQRDNIESARKALTQLDSAVDQTLARTDDVNGATKSANLRRSQTRERVRLQKDIDEAQVQITKLQEERAPIASKFRKVEAEVGPIKYIAALIYGDKTDQNTLEAAVRWVIIIIVFVFDPLAIILILAATTSIDWSKLDRRKKKHDDLLEQLEDAKDAALAAEAQAQLLRTGHEGRDDEPELDQSVFFNEPDYDLLEQHLQEQTSKIEEEIVERNRLVRTVNDLENEIAIMLQEQQDSTSLSKKLLAQLEESDEQLMKALSDRNALAEELAKVSEVTQQTLSHEDAPIDHNVDTVFQELPPIIIEAPDMLAHADSTIETREVHADFGTSFPALPEKGDMFMRVDYLPSKLFKWNGSKWMELDKASTDSFTYDEKYIQLLVSKISHGEYDIDDLSAIEQEQIHDFLNKHDGSKI